MPVEQIAVDRNYDRVLQVYRIISCSTDTKINLYFFVDGHFEFETQIDAHQDRINCVKFFQNFILSSSNDTTLKMWKLESIGQQAQYQRPLTINRKKPITIIKILDHDKFAFVSHNTLNICCHQRNQNFNIFVLESVHTSEIRFFKRVKDSAYVSICEDNRATVWKITAEHLFNETNSDLSLPSGNAGICCVKTIRDKNLLVCGYTNGSIVLWNINGLTEFRTLNESTSTVTCINIHPRFLIAGFQNGQLITWSVENNYRLDENVLMRRQPQTDRFANFMKLFKNANVLVSYNNRQNILDGQNRTALRYVINFPSEQELNAHISHVTSCLKKFKTNWIPSLRKSFDDNALIGTCTGHLLVPLLDRIEYNVFEIYPHDGEITYISSKLDSVEVA